MSLDLISSIETRFFSDEIDDPHIDFDLENNIGTSDDMLSINRLLEDPMQVSFLHNDCESMDSGVTTDSDTYPCNDLQTFNINNMLDLSTHFANFSEEMPSFTNDIASEIKLEPVSPLAQSPQPLSPVSQQHGITSIFEVKGEAQPLPDTPPISPPGQTTSPGTGDVIKIIAVGPDGNVQVTNGPKIMLSPNSSVLNVLQTPSVPFRPSNIQPKPAAAANPVVIRVSQPPNIANKQGQQQIVVSTESLASLANSATSHKPPLETNLAGNRKSLGGSGPKGGVSMKPHPSTATTNETDLKALKRQQRMIKNRESACLSRKKKKEYVSSLEATLSEVSKENQQLKLENAALRERIVNLEKERDVLKGGSGTAKQTTALYAVLLLFSFNIAFIGNNILGQSSAPSLVETPKAISRDPVYHRTSRSLLWADDENLNFDTTAGNSSNPMCPTLINVTESTRIDSELRGWFHAPSSASNRRPVVQKLNSTPSAPPVKPKTQHELVKVQPRPASAISTAYRKYLLTAGNENLRAAEPSLIAKNEIQVYETLPDRYLFAAFFEAIQKKDDTFYVVSFSDDHLLLPASEHKTTARPRMSLLLPTVPLNETMRTPQGHVSMMQIDCEVTNTRLLHISLDSIPSFPSAGVNRTTNRKSESVKRAWRKNIKKNSQKNEDYENIPGRSSN